MTVTIVGGALVLLGLVTLLVRRRLFVWVLAASAAFPATAAVTLGDNSVPPFFVLAVLGLPLLFTRPAADVVTRVPLVARLLLAFVAVCLVVTTVAPLWFSGIPILLPRGGIDAQVLSQTPLGYTASMAAQLVYLGLGVAMAVVVARQVRPGSRLPEAAFVVGIGLSTLRWVCDKGGVDFPIEQFRTYAHVTFGSDPTRFDGIFPEPSYLAVFGLAAAAYYAVRLRTARRVSLLTTVLMLGMSVFDLVVSASGTAVLAGLITVAVLYLQHVVPFLLGRRRLTLFAVLLLGAPILLAATAGPIVRAITEVIETKAGSESAAHRFASDHFSLHVFTETFGVGVGVGANRPSSFLTMLLSCTGLVGTLLFLAVVVALIGTARRVGAAQAASWSFGVLILAKSIGEPSLSAPLMWLLMGVVLAVSMRGGAERLGDKRRGDEPVRRREPARPRHRLAV